MTSALIKSGRRAAKAAETVPVRAVIYLRLSDLRSTDVDTFEPREQKVRELAERLGWTVVDVIIENDYSKKNGKVRIASAFKRKWVTLPDGERTQRVIRPGFNVILAGMRSGRFDAILAEDLDRVVRDPWDGENLLTLSAMHGTNAASVSGSLRLTNGGTSDEQFMFRTMVNAAFKSSSDYARRVREARERNMCRAMGNGGHRPFGWMADYKTADPFERAIVHGCMLRVMHDISLAAIARELSEAGVPSVTGAPWSAKTLRSILARPRNAGLVVYQGEIVDGLKGEWEPLVEESLYRAVLTKVSDKSRRTQMGRAPTWTGSGIYLCGVCGDGTSVNVGGARKGRAARYKCRKSNHLACSVPVADDAVLTWCADRLSQEDALYMWAPAKPDVDIAELTAERTALQENASTMALAALKDRSMWADYLIVREHANARIKELDRDIASASTGTDIVNEFLNSLTVKADIKKALEDAPLATRRAIIKTIARVTIEPAGHGARSDVRTTRIKIVENVWTRDQVAA